MLTVSGNKKGISPLIATVLIIGFTIVLSALVITWASGLFKKTVSDTDELAEFNLLCTTGFDVDYTAQKSGNNIVVKAKSKNDKNIFGFVFILKSDSSAVTFSTDQSVVKSTEDSTISPDKENAVLLSFETLGFTLKPGKQENWKNLEARPIGLVKNNKKVCDFASSADIA